MHSPPISLITSISNVLNYIHFHFQCTQSYSISLITFNILLNAVSHFSFGLSCSSLKNFNVCFSNSMWLTNVQLTKCNCVQLISILTYPITLIVCNWFQLVWLKSQLMPRAIQHEQAVDPLRSIMLDPVQPHSPRLPWSSHQTLHQTLHYAQYPSRRGFAYYADYAAGHYDVRPI